MSDATEDIVRALFGDRDCPRTIALRLKGTAVPVRAFCEMAAERGADRARVEMTADQVARQLGGTRMQVTDPWSWAANALRRVRGNAPHASDIWLIPD